MEDLVRYGSLAGSVISVLLTVYFWFVRSRGERANLRIYLIDREFFLGNSNATERQLGLKLGLIVANYSTLPNALLGVKVALKRRDGSWVDVEDVKFDPQTPVPLNVPALQTIALRISGRVRFPLNATLEQEKNVGGAYAAHFFDDPRTLRVDLKALNDKTFQETLA